LLITGFFHQAIEQNQKFVNKLQAFAERKSVSSAQLCLAWITTLGSHVVPIPGSSKPSRVVENLSSAKIQFTKEELAELNTEIENNAKSIAGPRYFTEDGKAEGLWA
jgi:pyridoxine 4-dehydrogenase